MDDKQSLHQRRDRLKQLRAFCQTARLGSVSRAAKQVMSSQPAVSLQLRTLEEELGVSLFERHGPRISLTQVGENFYRLAKPLVEGMDRLPDTFAEQYYGALSDTLRIGAGGTSAAYLLPDYLKRFREQYPEIRLEVKTGSGRQRLGWLRDYELDLAVSAVDIPPSDVEFHVVRRSELIVITPLDHPLVGRSSISLEDVVVYSLVVHPPTHHIRRVQEIALQLHGVTFPPNVVLEVDGWDSITSYVAAGVGISVVPDLCLSGDERLWKYSFKDILPSRKYGVITRRDGLLSRAARLFLRTMVPE